MITLAHLMQVSYLSEHANWNRYTPSAVDISLDADDQTQMAIYLGNNDDISSLSHRSVHTSNIHTNSSS